jgi:hypothetical protein
MEAKVTTTKHLPWVQVLMKMVSAAEISVDNTVRLMFLGSGIMFLL